MKLPPLFQSDEEIRDAYVFSLCRSMGKAVTWVLAGGYADIDTLVELHTGTVRVANEVLMKVKPGDPIENLGMKPYLWGLQNGAIQFPDWRSFMKRPLQANKPPPMSNGQVKEWVVRRERLLEEEVLSKDGVASAYEKFFPLGPSP